LLSWRRASIAQVRRRVTAPVVTGATVTVALAAVGMRNVAALAAYGLAAFVLAANLGELARGVGSFARASGRSVFAALVPATSRNRRLFGGLVVHVGIATMAIAITTSGAFAHQTEVTLARGDRVSFQGYVLEYRGMRTIRQPQRVVQ